MSHLHVIYKSKKKSYYLDDGKSDILDRYVNLDEDYIYYTMGKQISGKPINPNGATGRKLLRLASELAERDSQKPEEDIFLRKAWGYDIYKTPDSKVVYKKDDKALDMGPYNRRMKLMVGLFIGGFVCIGFGLFPLGLLCFLLALVMATINMF